MRELAADCSHAVADAGRLAQVGCTRYALLTDRVKRISATALYICYRIEREGMNFTRAGALSGVCLRLQSLALTFGQC